MNDQIDAIREHYGAAGLVERLRSALATFGPEDQRLEPQQLAQLDQFHIRGLAATAELAELAGITECSAVLDIGAGVGGPARFLAANCGCQVTGIDLSGPFVEAARYLTRRTGQSEQVVFELGSALDLPFADTRFDVALLQHVAMNIADRPKLYTEMRRVLRSGGKLATYDVVLRDGEPRYPVPWARTQATSFLLTAGQTLEAIERAGFRPLVVKDDSEAARVWAAGLRAGPLPVPNLGVIMGEDSNFAELTGNLARNLLEGRVGILTAVLEAAEGNESEGDTHDARNHF